MHKCYFVQIARRLEYAESGTKPKIVFDLKRVHGLMLLCTNVIM